jgi:hypothetical protein
LKTGKAGDTTPLFLITQQLMIEFFQPALEEKNCIPPKKNKKIPTTERIYYRGSGNNTPGATRISIMSGDHLSADTRFPVLKRKCAPGREMLCNNINQESLYA